MLYRAEPSLPMVMDEVFVRIERALERSSRVAYRQMAVA